MTDLSPDATSDFDATIDAPLPIEQPAPPPDVAAKPQTIDDAIDAAFAKAAGGQPRDEVGRFAPKSAQELSKPATAAPQQPGAPEAPPSDGVKPVQMPASWARDKAALWAGASPELQAQIAAREEAISRGLSRYEGLAAYADLAERNGTNLKQVFDRARGWEEAMSRDPVAAIGHAIRVFGVDPARIVAALSGGNVPQQSPGGGGLPPQYVAELQGLRQSVEELRAAPVQQQVSAFFNDPANKFANQVADTMALFLKAEPGLTLKDAYDRACWADPSVRSAVLQEQQAAQAAKTAAAARASTQRAQTASKGLSGSSVPPLNGASVPKFKTVDEAISAAFAQHGAPL